MKSLFLALAMLLISGSVFAASEAGAMGAALTVAVGMGIYPDMEAIDDIIRVFLNNPQSGTL